MTTTIRNNGTVELDGITIGTLTRNEFGAWVSPTIGDRPARLHDTRRQAAETLIAEHQDLQEKADPNSGWVERFGVLWIAYDKHGARIGSLYNTRDVAREAVRLGHATPCQNHSAAGLRTTKPATLTQILANNPQMNTERNHIVLAQQCLNNALATTDPQEFREAVEAARDWLDY